MPSMIAKSLRWGGTTLVEWQFPMRICSYVLMAVIWWFSIMSPPGSDRLPYYMFGVLRRDLALHFTAYGGLSFVYFGGRSNELRPHIQHSAKGGKKHRQAHEHIQLPANTGIIRKQHRLDDRADGAAAYTACATGVAVLLMHSLVKEVVQSFVPGRDGALDDVAADMCGTAVGLVAVWVLLRA